MNEKTDMDTVKSEESLKESKTDTRTKILAVIGVIAFLAIILMLFFVVPGVERSKAENNLNICAYNLKSIVTELDNYARMNEGNYPDNLSILVENKRLSKIPACPGAKIDTYSESYRVSDDRKNFTIFCSGSHHLRARSKADHPFYTSSDGIVKKN